MLKRNSKPVKILGLANLGGLAVVLLLGGCGPGYQEMRLDGQHAMVAGDYRKARIIFQQADEKAHRRADNLHDLGVCSLMIAKEKFDEYNYPAALREVDNALRYYSWAINELPGYQPALEGKNIALEMKGRFEDALKHTEWAVKFVGPSAKQYLFLAAEYEERRDPDGAMLAYRQAIAIEPQNAEARRAYAQFLLKNRRDTLAAEQLQTAYRLDPRNEWVNTQLAQRGMFVDRSGPVLQSH